MKWLCSERREARPDVYPPEDPRSGAPDPPSAIVVSSSDDELVEGESFEPDNVLSVAPETSVRNANAGVGKPKAALVSRTVTAAIVRDAGESEGGGGDLNLFTESVVIEELDESLRRRMDCRCVVRRVDDSMTVEPLGQTRNRDHRLDEEEFNVTLSGLLPNVASGTTEPVRFAELYHNE